MTLSQAIRERAANSGMSAAQQLAYMIGATEARIIAATAAASALNPTPKGK
jgi:hypothetical protein